MSRQDLLIIACSERKKPGKGPLPAIDLYDGPAYRLLRKRLDGARNPTVWVLSAKHGLIWADLHIHRYDQRLTKERAQLIRTKAESFIERHAPPGGFRRVFIWAGKQYFDALPTCLLSQANIVIADGPIGRKLHLLKDWCTEWQAEHKNCSVQDRQVRAVARVKRAAHTPLCYFIPDWNDYLDPTYDFANDRFSWDTGERVRLYAHELFRRRPLYDGILVSLGNIVMGKGPAANGLQPKTRQISARRYLHLKRHQLLMGDCGAFSYRRLPAPPFTIEQATTLYRVLNVDIGASIDHIPFGEVEENGKLRPLTDQEADDRIELTARLAREFLAAVSGASKFIPMGVVQARFKEEYGSIAEEYVKAGYRYVALGSLVRRRDDDILQIVETVVSTLERSFPVDFPSIRIHLLGVLRESLLPRFRQLGVASFDSGSYLRKAWLRSDKNYLSVSGEWYTAIRVPFSNDPRFVKAALAEGVSGEELCILEAECLRLLRQYDRDGKGLAQLLDTVLEYDGYLLRAGDGENFREKYERTLTDAPWRHCTCPVCRHLGIEVLIFRGFNRNKRRGFHNTWVFYNRLRKLRS